MVLMDEYHFPSSDSAKALCFCFNGLVIGFFTSKVTLLFMGSLEISIRFSGAEFRENLLLVMT